MNITKSCSVVVCQYVPYKHTHMHNKEESYEEILVSNIPRIPLLSVKTKKYIYWPKIIWLAQHTDSIYWHKYTPGTQISFYVTNNYRDFLFQRLTIKELSSVFSPHQQIHTSVYTIMVLSGIVCWYWDIIHFAFKPVLILYSLNSKGY